MNQRDVRELVDVLLDFSGDKIVKHCEDELKEGISPNEIFNDLSRGLDEIGKRYEKGRFFTSDLIVSGSNMKKAVEFLRPRFERDASTIKGRVLIGTVKGDVHDIGKTIFSMMLQSKGFEVIDLGVDVSIDEFLKNVERNDPDILAMSALLTSTMSNMAEVIERLKEGGIREKVKIIVGGRPITEDFAEEIGADEYGENAVEGVRKCLSLMGRV